MKTHVALTPGLDSLAKKLMQHGFIVVDPENNEHTPAALIYSRRSTGTEYRAEPLAPAGSNTGLTMLIDADTTPEDEVIRLLSQQRL